MKSKLLFIISFTLSIFCCCQMTFSQEIIKVVAVGKSISPGNLSPRDARNDAINEAKRNALRNAGIKESVSVSSVMFTSEGSYDFSQLFSEISVIESDGEIIVDTVIDKYQDIVDDHLIYEVEIGATIFKYHNKKDPELEFNVKGINDVYFTSEKLFFSFTPAQNGYLKIFNINKNNASLIYPSHLDNKDNLFIKDNTILFPVSPAYKPGYSLQIDDAKEAIEINSLIFVYTKKNIAISSILSINNILKWIYCISPDKRSVQYFSVIIKKSKQK
ncbi:MAG: DUF4384 domain-containing protein [Bacteroidales bacterium]|nr:DUF4384 domain-containing protein [Bacteroidales bacterium]